VQFPVARRVRYEDTAVHQQFPVARRVQREDTAVQRGRLPRHTADAMEMRRSARLLLFRCPRTMSETKTPLPRPNE